jgi:hypothetical protein
MSAETEITTRIGSLAGGRVFAVDVPQGTARPYIVWQEITGVPVSSHGEATTSVDGIFQVSCLSETFSEAKSLRSSVIAAMEAFGSGIPTALIDVRMLREDAPTPPLFNAQADFSMFHQL